MTASAIRYPLNGRVLDVMLRPAGRSCMYLAMRCRILQQSRRRTVSIRQYNKGDWKKPSRRYSRPTMPSEQCIMRKANPINRKHEIGAGEVQPIALAWKTQSITLDAPTSLECQKPRLYFRSDLGPRRAIEKTGRCLSDEILPLFCDHR